MCAATCCGKSSTLCCRALTELDAAPAFHHLPFMALVKICGLTDPDLVGFAAREGADWIGFVFVDASPRRVTAAAVASLLMQVGKAVPVALLVDASDAEIDAVRAIGIRVLQLHGSETPQRLAEIRARTGCEVWKALGVSSRVHLDDARAYKAADRLLLDAKPPDRATRTGGHGETFDWSILDGWQAPAPWMLAGGLTPDTVATAIAATGAPAVDVSTGVERIRGLKDRELVRAFIRAAKHPGA
jgi:phosphoribosylanthranilate isomerase